MKENAAQMQIRMAIKNLLKKNSFKYSQIAKQMNMSEASFKQLINKGKLSVERLEHIAAFFDLSLWELMDLCKGVEVLHSNFSMDQEKVLSKNSLAMRLFILLSTGMSLGTVRNRMKTVDSKKINSCLFLLAKLNLVEIYEEDAIRLKKRGPFRFLSNGPLIAVYKKKYIENVTTHFHQSSEKDYANRVFELFGTKDMAKKMALELNELIARFTSLSRLETKTKPENELWPFSCAFLIHDLDGWGKTLVEN